MVVLLMVLCFLFRCVWLFDLVGLVVYGWVSCWCCGVLVFNFVLLRLVVVILFAIFSFADCAAFVWVWFGGLFSWLFLRCDLFGYCLFIIDFVLFNCVVWIGDLGEFCWFVVCFVNMLLLAAYDCGFVSFLVCGIVFVCLILLIVLMTIIAAYILKLNLN